MKSEEFERLIAIARMYYEQDMTQAEIAKTLGLSRPVVSRLLSEARRTGIVRIEVRSPLDEKDHLLSELIHTFGIRGGLVVPTGTTDEGVNRELMISQAALFLRRLRAEIRRLGIGWGETIRDVIEALEGIDATGDEDRSVCPVIGSAPSAMQWYQTNELTRIVADKWAFEPFYLHAPAFPVSASDRDLFTGTEEYRRVSELWGKLDTVLLSAGTYPTVPDHATAARFGDQLKQRKAVGVLATHYYDIAGTMIESPSDYAVRIPLEDLQRADRVVVVAGGMDKVRAIRGALMTGLVTHLITDEGTVKELLALHATLSAQPG